MPYAALKAPAFCEFCRIDGNKGPECDQCRSPAPGRQSRAAPAPIDGEKSRLLLKNKKRDDLFQNTADGATKVCWHDLQKVLSDTMQKEFSKEACRSLITMVDKIQSGKIDIEGIEQLCRTVDSWNDIFNEFNLNCPGHQLTHRLREALASIGYEFNDHILHKLLGRFGNKNGKMEFDDFLMCAVRVKTVIGAADIVLILILSSLAVVPSQTFSQNNNGNDSQTLPLLRSCKSSSLKNDFQNNSLEDKSCYCDKDCAYYGDCCPDSSHFSSAEQHHTRTSFECLHTIYHGIISSKKACPLHWTNQKVKKKCQQNDEGEENMSLMLPVISRASNKTYRYIYCGICNGEKDFTLLQTVIHSQMHQRQPQTEEFGRKKEHAKVIEDARYKYKRIIIGINSSVENTTFRSCISSFDKSYTGNSTDAQTHNTNIVFNGVEYIRNSKCRNCKGSRIQTVSSSLESSRVRKYRSTNGTDENQVLQTRGNNVGKNSSHSKTLSEFPFSRECVQNDSKQGDCILVHREITVINGASPTDKHFQHFNTCTNFSCNGQPIPYSSLVKMMYFVPQQPFYDYPKYFVVFNNMFFKCIELTTSVTLLILHLSAFILSFQESTLFDKTIASLCFSELLFYFLTIYHEVPYIVWHYWRVDINTITCVPRSVLIQYCVLTTYSWILMISFQIWYTTRQACVRMRRISNNDHFIYYCVCGWVVPGVISLVLPLLDAIPGDTVPLTLKPNLRENFCAGIWKEATLLLSVFVYVPAFFVLILSLYFLYDTVRMIDAHKFRSNGVRDLAENGISTNFRFWFKLVSLMAPGWDLLCITILHTILEDLSSLLWEAISKLMFLGGHILFFVLTLLFSTISS